MLSLKILKLTLNDSSILALKVKNNTQTKSAERFSDCLRVLIHCLMPTFEHCSLLLLGREAI